MKYSFGGNTGQTYEQLQRKRSLAEAMMAQQKAPQNVGEGISSAARSIAGALIARKADKGLAQGKADFDSKWSGLSSALMGAQGGGSTASAPMALVEAPELRKGLIERGLPEHIADGFLMNFQDESGLNPGINEQNPIVPGSRGGFGLSQWTGPRRKALEAFAQQHGKPVSDPNLQLDFLMTELQGSESEAFEKIMGTQDAGSAAAAIATHFLRPAQEHLDRRVAKYTGGASPSGSGGSGLAQAMQLAQLAASPYASGEQKALAQALMQQQMQANDPMRQLQMQNLQSQIAARQAGPEPTADQRNYQFYAQQEQEAGREPLSFNEWDLQSRRAGATTINNSVGAGGVPEMNVDQGKNTGFLLRMEESEQVLRDLDVQGTQALQQNLDKAPFGNYLRTSEFQRFDQARRDFINALLRRESGAVISPQEFENAEQQYFPVPGDTAEVIEQKRQNRLTAIAGVRASSGPGGSYVDSLRQKQEDEPTAAEPEAAPKENPYLGITDEDFRNLDISNLTPEQIDQLYEARQ